MGFHLKVRFLKQWLNPTCVSYLSYLHCFHMEVGLGMRLGGPGLWFTYFRGEGTKK